MLVRALKLPETAERRFVDVSGPNAANIETLAAAGLAAGCAADRFCPEQPLTRAQMASLLARALRYPPASAPFSDLPAVHAGAIGALHSRGLITGCTSAKFCPSRSLTRAQVASVLSRTF
jgi:hypothetical protein